MRGSVREKFRRGLITSLSAQLAGFRRYNGKPRTIKRTTRRNIDYRTSDSWLAGARAQRFIAIYIIADERGNITFEKLKHAYNARARRVCKVIKYKYLYGASTMRMFMLDTYCVIFLLATGRRVRSACARASAMFAFETAIFIKKPVTFDKRL